MEMDLRGFSPAGEVFVFLIVVFILAPICCCFVTRTEVILLRLFAILMSRIYLMNYYMLRIWSRFSCQVFCFVLFFFLVGGWGGCHSQGFYSSQFNESFSKVFSDAGEVFVVVFIWLQSIVV